MQATPAGWQSPLRAHHPPKGVVRQSKDVPRRARLPRPGAPAVARGFGVGCAAALPQNGPAEDSRDTMTEPLHGLMMDFPLTLAPLLERAEKIFGRVQIVSRRPDRALGRAA